MPVINRGSRPFNIFDNVPKANVNKSVVSLSHAHKTTMKMGLLYPILALDMVPGDVFKVATEYEIRFAPLVYPIFHQIKVDLHAYFVPNRIIFPQWDEFIVQGMDTAIEAPTFFFEVDNTLPPNRALAGYLGLPLSPLENGGGNVGLIFPLDAQPVAAYVKIWDDYYRSDIIQEERFVRLLPGDNPDYEIFAFQPPFYRNREHDYFTSALPTPQLGQNILIPGDIRLNTAAVGTSQVVRDASTYGITIGAAQLRQDSGPNAFLETVGGIDKVIDPNGTLIGDGTIAELRLAIVLQEFLERFNRTGQRYRDVLKGFFGVTPQDMRIDYPEYIWGSSNMVGIGDVMSTAQTTSTIDTVLNPVGAYAGQAGSADRTGRNDYLAVEHGWYIVLMSIMPTTSYYQGIPKRFTRYTALDYLWPQFNNIGDQPIKNYELYMDWFTPDGLANQETFGYIPRYSEYRFCNDIVSGQLRDPKNQPWHLARDFDAAPPLDSEFLEARIRTDIFSIQPDETEDYLYVNIFHDILAIRPVSQFGTPSIIPGD